MIRTKTTVWFFLIVTAVLVTCTMLAYDITEEAKVQHEILENSSDTGDHPMVGIPDSGSEVITRGGQPTLE